MRLQSRLIRAAQAAVVASALAAPWLVHAQDGVVVAQAASAAATHAVSDPYSIGALWTQSDAIQRAVLAILVLMSGGSWFVLISKFVEQSRIQRQGKEAAKGFWTAPTVREGAEALAKDSPFRYLAEAGLDATGRHLRLARHIGLNEWVSLSIERAVEKVQGSQQRGLAFLAAVSSTAPFVGLFGTVWGIYHALSAIGAAGQASIDKVAGPVGEALVMTAIGLAVAVPALLGYNWLARRNQATLDSVQHFGDELHTVLLAQTPA
ncbi:MotA/TolQ/ExbB proton channel family protein [Roseateles sp. BYS180W]|uniref:Biopolymer transport protein ExbB n=1 Tax=Roseateles rivi TaxID=3299028 RepID=A0ABW7FU92_9BURK